MNKNLTPKQSQIVLTEMCERVGENAETFDFDQPDWFCKHEWTQEEEADFASWLADFLEKEKIVPKGKYRGKRWALHEASKMTAFFGWKTKI